MITSVQTEKPVKPQLEWGAQYDQSQRPAATKQATVVAGDAL